MSKLIDLLNIQAEPAIPAVPAVPTESVPPAELVPPAPEELVGMTDEEVAEITTPVEDIDVELELAPAIAGMEGMCGLMDRPLFSRAPLTSLSGCEGYAVGIVGCYGVDLRSYSGQEGFVESVKKGLKATIDVILNAIKRVWDFFFGSKESEKKLDTLKDDIKEVEKLSPEDKQKITPAPEQLKNIASSMEGKFDSKVNISNFISGDNREKLDISGFLKALDEETEASKKNLDKAEKETKPKLDNARKKVESAQSKLSSLGEDDKEKKAEISNVLEEANHEVKEASEEMKAVTKDKQTLEMAGRLAEKFSVRIRKVSK